MLAFVFLNCTPVLAYNGDVIVYVTDTGECYHRDGCTYLKSKRPITLELADRKYWPCSRCDPPVLGMDSPQDTERYYSYYERKELERAQKEEAERRAEEEKKKEEAEIAQEREKRKEHIIFFSKICAPIVILALNAVIVRSVLQYRRERREHEARCAGELPGGMPGMPFGTIIGEDGLPRNIKAKVGWGLQYTFYVSRTGHCFHRSGCTREACIMVHAALLGNRKPCKKCKPIRPNLSWFNIQKSPPIKAPQPDPTPAICVPESEGEEKGKMEYWLDIKVKGKKVRIYAHTPDELANKIEEIRKSG